MYLIIERPDKFVKINTYAKYVGKSHCTIIKWINTGKISAIELDGTKFIDIDYPSSPRIREAV